MVMKNMAGTITIKNSILKMSNLSFNTLGGKFLTNGTYNTQNMEKLLFDFDLKMDNILIKEAFNTFSTVQAFAPIAKTMEGTFSSTMGISGILGNDMMPKYETVSGDGIATILEAQLKENKVLSTMAAVTKIKELDPMAMENVKVSFRIKDGKLFVQ